MNYSRLCANTTAPRLGVCIPAVRPRLSPVQVIACSARGAAGGRRGVLREPHEAQRSAIFLTSPLGGDRDRGSVFRAGHGGGRGKQKTMSAGTGPPKTSRLDEPTAQGGGAAFRRGLERGLEEAPTAAGSPARRP